MSCNICYMRLKGLVWSVTKPTKVMFKSGFTWKMICILKSPLPNTQNTQICNTQKKHAHSNVIKPGQPTVSEGWPMPLWTCQSGELFQHRNHPQKPAVEASLAVGVTWLVDTQSSGSGSRCLLSNSPFIQIDPIGSFLSTFRCVLKWLGRIVVWRVWKIEVSI